MLYGLCLSAPANTTVDASAQGSPTVNIAPQAESQRKYRRCRTADCRVACARAAGESLHFTLLLPLQSESLGSAARAARAGFLAAYEQEKAGVSVTVLETGDAAEEAVARFNDAQSTSDVIIGPLTRSAAAALAQSGSVHVPTIALTQLDGGDGAPAMSPLMLAMGLSVEDEARQAAAWIAAGKPAAEDICGLHRLASGSAAPPKRLSQKRNRWDWTPMQSNWAVQTVT